MPSTNLSDRVIYALAAYSRGLGSGDIVSGMVMAVPIKIIYVIDHFKSPHAGTEGQLYQLVKHLDRARFQPHFLVFSTSEYLESNGFLCDYTVLGHSSLSSPRTWFALWRTARKLRKDGYRLAHVFFNDPSVICPPVFSLAGIRTVISRRDMGYWYTPLMKFVLRHTRRYVRGALVNSEAVKGVTARAERIPLDKIHVIYNGFEEEPAPRIAPEPIEILAQLKRQGKVLAGLVANIRSIKRIHDAIRALGSIKNQCPGLHLVIIGAGDSTELKALAVSLGVPQRVHFLGSRSDVRHCLQYLDIGLLCSESEGFSNAIVEYLYAGLPVICTNVGGNPEAVIDGKTGFLYAVGDVPELSDRLKELACDTEQLMKMAEAAQEDARTRFSLSRMIAGHEAHYSVLAGHQEPESATLARRS